jgi:ketosteroid isomerase-like protein
VPSRNSEENINLVEAAYQLSLDRCNGPRTARSIDRFLALLSDSIVFVPEGGAPRHRGHRAMRRLLADATEQWKTLRYELDEIIDLGAGELIACGKVLAQPDEGPPREIPFVNRWIIRAGRAVRIDSFADRNHALTAART